MAFSSKVSNKLIVTELHTYGAKLIFSSINPDQVRKISPGKSHICLAQGVKSLLFQNQLESILRPPAWN